MTNRQLNQIELGAAISQFSRRGFTAFGKRSHTSFGAYGTFKSENQTIQLNGVEWQANPNISGVQSAIVVGDPSSTELYLVLSKYPIVSRLATVQPIYREIHS